jgi:hypothetical protein
MRPVGSNDQKRKTCKLWYKKVAIPATIYVTRRYESVKDPTERYLLANKIKKSVLGKQKTVF